MEKVTRKSKIGRWMPFTLALMVMFAFAACDLLTGPEGPAGAQGPAGDDGAAGLAGPSVYLVDAAGTRVYSGGTYFMGTATDPDSLIRELRIVNKSHDTLTIGSMSVEFETFFQVDPWGDWYRRSGTVPEITHVATETTELPPGETSEPIEFTLQYVTREGEARKRFLIVMTDSDGEFTFAVEVYGLINSLG